MDDAIEFIAPQLASFMHKEDGEEVRDIVKLVLYEFGAYVQMQMGIRTRVELTDE